MSNDFFPDHGSYNRGFRTGCLLGCTPLILLFLLVAFWIGSDFLRFHNRAPRENASSVPLPRIASTSPAAELLPAPPPANRAPIYLGDDLSCVPELMLEAAPQLTTDQWKNRKAQVAAAALHLNMKEEDGFLKALRNSRPDLAGVPFAMGDACRTRGTRARTFKEAAEAVRRRKGAALVDEDSDPEAGKAKRRQLDQAHLAVVSQVIATEDLSGQHALIRALASIPRPEATRALARLAVFSMEADVRADALEALAVRRDADATEVLVAGLSYPWPAVAEHAAHAIVRLKRTDLIPHLKAMLQTPDPRGPRAERVDGREETVAHELVRISHLRNCLLCHAPARRGQTPDETLVAEVPVPTLPLPDTRTGYGQTESNLLVRIDVTYLRQDFSVLQAVDNAHPWPEMQRFDFLVRKRVLTEAEARSYRDKLQPREPGRYSPYHRAIVTALRELTGRDTGPTGSDWRKLLEQIEQSRKAAEKVERGSGS